MISFQVSGHRWKNYRRINGGLYISACLAFKRFGCKTFDEHQEMYKDIEDIYFFGMNTKYISLSGVTKNLNFSRVHSTSESVDISPQEMKYIWYFPKKMYFFFLFYTQQEIQKKQNLTFP